MAKYVVVATPRSGTAYTARVLSNLGLDCGHERYFALESRLEQFLQASGTLGESSWLAVPFLDQLPPDVRVVHQVREPLKVIHSLLQLQFVDLDAAGQPRRVNLRRSFTEFALRHCPQVLAYRTELERAAWFYYHWNRRIDAHAAQREIVRIRLEDFDAALLNRLLAFIGVDQRGWTDAQIATALSAISKDVNAKTDEKVMVVEEVTWATLPREVCELARTYGYAVDAGPVKPATGGAAACEAAFEIAHEQIRRAQVTWHSEREHQVEAVASLKHEARSLRHLVRELQTLLHAAQEQARQTQRDAKAAREKLVEQHRLRVEDLNAKLAHAAGAHKEVARQRDEIRATGQRLKEDLRVAAHQREHLVREQEQLRQRLDAAARDHQQHLDATARERERLEAAVAETKANWETARKEGGRVSAAARETRRQLEDRTATVRKLRVALAEAQKRCRSSNALVQFLKKSLTLRDEEVRYRLGDAFVGALKHPRDFVLLPVRLVSLFFEGLRRTLNRRHPSAAPPPVETTPAPVAAAPESPSAAPVEPPAEAAVRSPEPARRRQTDAKISVIMTAFNSRAYLSAALDSILAQTHRNLELIVVDDASTDGTFALLCEYRARDARVRPFKSLRNQGTYWSKNFGLTRSTGTYVAFQDSDDVSEPERLETQLDEIERNPGAVASTCDYVRCDERGQIVSNRGLAQRLALIGLLFKRAPVLERVGYFDSVRVAADDEFFQRLRIAFGRDAVRHVNRPLYVACLRDGSLTTSGPAPVYLNEVGTAAQPGAFLSPVRREYAEAYQRWHHLIRSGSEPVHLSFPQAVRRFASPQQILPDGALQTDWISASVVSIPSRVDQLRRVVENILPQVHHLNVYLNNYEEIPAFLNHPRVRVARSQDHGDLRDNGKFFFLAQVPRGYHFTLDDDLEYPSDYVQKLLLKIEQYGRRAILGVHGMLLADPFERFFTNRTVLHFHDQYLCDRLVNLLGTGTVAYHTDSLRLATADFGEVGMADVWLAVAAKRQGVPMIAMARPKGWVCQLGDVEDSLYVEFMRADDVQTRVAREAELFGNDAFRPVWSPLARDLLARFTEAELCSREVDVEVLRQIATEPAAALTPVMTP